jgi:hypothetical protein
MFVPEARSTVQVYGDEVAVAMFSSWSGDESALNTDSTVMNEWRGSWFATVDCGREMDLNCFGAGRCPQIL